MGIKNRGLSLEPLWDRLPRAIVPYDASKRGPIERAKMLKRLESTKVAYEWRKEHVSSFEEEIGTKETKQAVTTRRCG